MAILFENESKCSICDEILEEKQEKIAWTAFLPPNHYLWRYSDSGMHKNCFENWDHKEEFEKLYRFQPLIDFEDEQIKKQIEKQGLPEWLKKIRDYREGMQ